MYESLGRAARCSAAAAFARCAGRTGEVHRGEEQGGAGGRRTGSLEARHSRWWPRCGQEEVKARCVPRPSSSHGMRDTLEKKRPRKPRLINGLTDGCRMKGAYTRRKKLWTTPSRSGFSISATETRG